MKIKQLPKEIAHKIAAGEVIERPASVLKELLENSIDACASDINVSINKGGVKCIQVCDNGHGISKEELPLAIMQHATSKITCVADLFSVKTLGFRGEALASIAAVSKLTISSKVIYQKQAWRLQLVDDYYELLPVALGYGTRIEVNDLFYNVPVRKKFLRSERTEMLQIEQIFNRIALSHFDKAFNLYCDDKLRRQLPSCHNEMQRLNRLRKLAGQNVIDSCQWIKCEQSNMTLQGWIGHPSNSRPQSDRQYFYINGRMVKDKLINHAIRQIYHEFNPNIRYPIYFLYFIIPPSSIDVNIHPTKHEVRFHESRVVHQFIIETLKATFNHAKIPNSKKEVVNLDLKFSERSIKYNDDIWDKINCVRNINSNSNINLETQARLWIIGKKIILIKEDELIHILNLESLWYQWLNLQLELNYQKFFKIPTFNLVEPKIVSLNQEINYPLDPKIALSGWHIEVIGLKQCVIRAMPTILKDIAYDFKKFLLNICQQPKHLTEIWKLMLNSIIDWPMEKEKILQMQADLRKQGKFCIQKTFTAEDLSDIITKNKLAK